MAYARRLRHIRTISRLPEEQVWANWSNCLVRASATTGKTVIMVMSSGKKTKSNHKLYYGVDRRALFVRLARIEGRQAIEKNQRQHKPSAKMS